MSSGTVLVHGQDEGTVLVHGQDEGHRNKSEAKKVWRLAERVEEGMVQRLTGDELEVGPEARDGGAAAEGAELDGHGVAVGHQHGRQLLPAVRVQRFRLAVDGDVHRHRVRPRAPAGQTARQGGGVV